MLLFDLLHVLFICYISTNILSLFCETDNINMFPIRNLYFNKNNNVTVTVNQVSSANEFFIDK